mmetsp:Transcript_37718/g.96500  ORF Transcript_37718/g.96500 Transcript_37718/m.96500 type:complete len:246 (-) Transcript_37718:2-739(-)
MRAGAASFDSTLLSKSAISRRSSSDVSSTGSAPKRLCMAGMIAGSRASGSGMASSRRRSKMKSSSRTFSIGSAIRETKADSSGPHATACSMAGEAAGRLRVPLNSTSESFSRARRRVPLSGSDRQFISRCMFTRYASRSSRVTPARVGSYAAPVACAVRVTDWKDSLTTGPSVTTRARVWMPGRPPKLLMLTLVEVGREFSAAHISSTDFLPPAIAAASATSRDSASTECRSYIGRQIHSTWAEN